MASNFTTIGLRIDSEAAYAELDARAVREGDGARGATTPDGTYAPWAMGAGVELWTQVGPDGRSLGFVPHYAGEARMAVRLEERVTRPGREGPLDGGFYLWSLDSHAPRFDNYPLVVDVPDFRAFDDLPLPLATTVPVVCFARELEIFADERALADSGSHMAAESLIPSGTFHPGGGAKDPMEAEAIIYGTIQMAAQRTNPVTGHQFLWLRVHTLGAQLEVIADPSVLTAGLPVPGAIASAMGWLTGRPDRVPQPLPARLVDAPAPVDRGPLVPNPSRGALGRLRGLLDGGSR